MVSVSIRYCQTQKERSLPCPVHFSVLILFGQVDTNSITGLGKIASSLKIESKSKIQRQFEVSKMKFETDDNKVLNKKNKIHK